MSTFDDTVTAMAALAKACSGLQEQALRRCGLEVDVIIRTGSRDVRLIERTLDGLLDIVDTADALCLFKRLCRHYWTFDKVAAAEYVMIYRDIWDSQPAPETEAKP